MISFLLILGLPAVLSLGGVNYYNTFFPESENAPKPTLDTSWFLKDAMPLSTVKNIYTSIIDYKYEFDRYFNDHFVFKYELFDGYVLIVSNLLGADPMPHKVVMGKNEMMFCGNLHDDYINSSKGFTANDSSVVSAIASEISSQANWAAQHGIEYYFAVAPNKLSVYPENLDIDNYGNTPLRELVAQSLPTHINYLDFTSTLNTKKDFKLYHNDDTHWNHFAAYFAYEEFMAEVQMKFNEVEKVPFEAYRLDSIVSLQNDLARQIRVETIEIQYVFRSIDPSNAVLMDRIYRQKEVGAIEDFQFDFEKRYRNDSKKLKILVLRDSFGSAIVEFIRESFGESVFIWDNEFDTTMIANEHPDIVLNMIVERHLGTKVGNP